MKQLQLALILLLVITVACSKNEVKEDSKLEINSVNKTDCCLDKNTINESECYESNDVNSKAKITFVELGSVNCIPCKKMQPVMEAIEKKYGDQINVIFYDVWKADQKKYAEKYKIKLIPTQVFLDEEGKEIFRHEGFYPEDEIDKLLKQHGLEVLDKVTSNG